MKKTIFILALVAIAISSGLIFRQISPWNKIQLPVFNKVNANLSEISKKVAAPGPLVSQKQNPEAYLTQQGVFDWTNYYRKQQGLIALAFNRKLNSAAAAKLADLFANQYFEHVSPAGYGPSHWAENAGYAYIIIGENLAMGDFQNDKALVDGWMASPGHRANILNVKYQDIGIAVGRGQYNGQTVWMAVQEFGMPASACPAPDESLKAKIAQYESEITTLEAQISNLAAELQMMKKNLKTQAEIDAYNRLADQYNAMLLEHQSLSDGVDNYVQQYNSEVNIFNTCAGG